MSVQEELDGVLYWIQLPTYTILQVAVPLLLHGHMSFQNILWSHGLVTWYDYLISHAIYILTPLYDLMLEIKCVNAWETLSSLGLS